MHIPRLVLLSEPVLVIPFLIVSSHMVENWKGIESRHFRILRIYFCRMLSSQGFFALIYVLVCVFVCRMCCSAIQTYKRKLGVGAARKYDV